MRFQVAFICVAILSIVAIVAPGIAFAQKAPDRPIDAAQVIAEIVEITMPRSRTRSEIHHDPQYYRIRNHLVDFLVNRSKTYAGAEAEMFHDAKNPTVVRPGLEGDLAAVVAMPTDKPMQQLKQVVNQ